MNAKKKQGYKGGPKQKRHKIKGKFKFMTFSADQREQFNEDSTPQWKVVIYPDKNNPHLKAIMAKARELDAPLKFLYTDNEGRVCLQLTSIYKIKVVDNDNEDNVFTHVSRIESESPVTILFTYKVNKVGDNTYVNLYPKVVKVDEGAVTLDKKAATVEASSIDSFFGFESETTVTEDKTADDELAAHFEEPAPKKKAATKKPAETLIDDDLGEDF